MTSVTVWLPTETRLGGEHLPAWTGKIAPPSIRNWNVGCVVGSADVPTSGRLADLEQALGRVRDRDRVDARRDGDRALAGRVDELDRHRPASCAEVAVRLTTSTVAPIGKYADDLALRRRGGRDLELPRLARRRRRVVDAELERLADQVGAAGPEGLADLQLAALGLVERSAPASRRSGCRRQAPRR